MPKPNKFAFLDAVKEKAVVEPLVEEAPVVEVAPPAPAPVEPAPARQRRREKVGKRSDPKYLQVGAYIPITLDRKIKKALIDDGRDFSQLVEDLLTQWVSGKKL